MDEDKIPEQEKLLAASGPRKVLPPQAGGQTLKGKTQKSLFFFFCSATSTEGKAEPLDVSPPCHHPPAGLDSPGLGQGRAVHGGASVRGA